MKRFAVVAAFAASLVCMIPTAGSAASFNDSAPCPALGPLLVCPKAYVGQPYSLQLLAHDGCDVYWWEMKGTLPDGLTLSLDGVVSGTPKSSAKLTPWIWVHDLDAARGGPSWCQIAPGLEDNHSERQFVFETAPGLSIDQQSIRPGTLNQAYSVQFTATSLTNLNPRQGSTAQATWSLASGSLPDGVSLSSQGALTGTPTKEGSWTFVVRATGGGDVTDTETETLTVRKALVGSTTIRGQGAKSEIGIPFTGAVTASGGSGAYTFALASGTLPQGLQLGTDGAVTGTPTVPGRSTFAVRVTDSEGRATTVNTLLTVNAKLTIATLRLKPATVGKLFRAQVPTVGGVAPKGWTILRGKLPAGVKFGKKLGLFLGTPTKAGTYKLALQVVDALGAKASKNVTIVVK